MAEEVMVEETAVKLVEGPKTAEGKREAQIYTKVVAALMVCLILFGIMQLLGWSHVR